jgi:hypothetical protein
MTGLTQSLWPAIATAMAVMLPAIAALPGVASPEPGELLPPNTAYTILIDMRQDTWNQLNQYALFQQLQAQGVGAPNPGALPLIPELAYESAVAPWVGETVAMALLPLENPTDVVFEQNEVMIAPIADPAAFSTVFEDDLPGAIAALKERDPEVQTYEGVEIYYWQPLYVPSEIDSFEVEPPPPADLELPKALLKALPATADTSEADELWNSLPIEPGLAIARFPEFMVAARTPEAIEAWLELRPGDRASSLAQNEQFLRTLTHPQYDAALGVLYADLPELANYSAVDLALPDLPFNLPFPQDLLPSDLAALSTPPLTGNVEALIYPQPRGLRLQGRGYYNDAFLEALASTTQPASADMLNHIPEDSYGMISGHNLAGLWQELATTLAASEATQTFLAQARGFVTALTGLDLDEDVFGWMDEGFTVFLYPTRKTPLTNFAPELEIGLGIALQTSDRPTAEATFATLDDLIANFDIAVESTVINGQAATNWGDLLLNPEDPESLLGRTWVDEDTLLLTTSIDALSDLVQLEPAQALPNAFRFSESTRDFPVDNQGYLFVNAAPVRELIFSLFPPGPDQTGALDFRQLIAAVQALSGTVSFQEEYAQVDGLLMLAPTEMP